MRLRQVPKHQVAHSHEPASRLARAGGRPVMVPLWPRAARVSGAGQETAAFTSSATFFSTTGLHSWSA
jgi:hypothetical protein